MCYKQRGQPRFSGHTFRPINSQLFMLKVPKSTQLFFTFMNIQNSWDDEIYACSILCLIAPDSILTLAAVILISEYIALGNLVVLFPVLYQGDSLCASLISCVTLGKSQSLRDPHLINWISLFALCTSYDFIKTPCGKCSLN